MLVRPAFSLSILLVAFMTSPLLAKREAPKPVKPVSADGVQYRAVHERFTKDDKPAGLRAFVEAVDEKSGKSLGKVKVYEIVYDLRLETDVQDVYITELSIKDKTLWVNNERFQPYTVDLETKTVRLVKPGK